VLVLTRRLGESIVIGDDIVVTVLEVRNDQVRIGIDAPRSIKVHREEVYRQVERENAAAAASARRASAMLAGRAAPAWRAPEAGEPDPDESAPGSRAPHPGENG
jgi:carbon storage regulator